jgi:hypothetical protein
MRVCGIDQKPQVARPRLAVEPQRRLGRDVPQDPHRVPVRRMIGDVTGLFPWPVSSKMANPLTPPNPRRNSPSLT